MFSFWNKPKAAQQDSPVLSADELQKITHLQPPENSSSADVKLWEPVKEDHSEPAAEVAHEETVEDIERMYQEALNAMDTIETVEQEAGLSHASENELDTSELAAETELAADAKTDHKTSTATQLDSDVPTVEVSPEQILEAALFVGGTALTIKKLCYLLQDSFDNDYVEAQVDELNERYRRENRPYEILFGEGGYRLTLRPEYDRVRIRTFGMGPKEVKLSQDALEILALVAYQQPISKQEVTDLSKRNAGGTLQQLVRRELIEIERDEANPKNVKYRTAARFLQLFGLRDLTELPTAEDFEFK